MGPFFIKHCVQWAGSKTTNMLSIFKKSYTVYETHNNHQTYVNIRQTTKNMK